MIIPYIPNREDARAKRWREQLQLSLPELEVRFLSQMNQAQKQSCEVAIVANPDSLPLHALPNLRWLHSTWAGVENVVAAVAGTQVQLVRLQDPELSNRMAHSVLNWVMNMHQLVPVYRQQQQNCVWQQHDIAPPGQYRVALLGCGRLGQASGELLARVGYDVIGWGKRPKPNLGFNYRYGDGALQGVLQYADCIVLLLPQTPGTEELINHERLNGLAKRPALINFSRAAILNEADLQQALSQNLVSHAVLDVFPSEPLPADAWYWQHPKVTVLPHISAPTSMVSASAIIAQHIRDYLRSGELPPVVEPGLGY